MKYLALSCAALFLYGCSTAKELYNAMYTYNQTSADVYFDKYAAECRPLNKGYVNGYASVSIFTDNYSGAISASMKLKGDITLEGRVIAAQNNGDFMRTDFYFPLSCEDMRNATFHLIYGEEERTLPSPLSNGGHHIIYF